MFPFPKSLKLNVPYLLRFKEYWRAGDEDFVPGGEREGINGVVLEQGRSGPVNSRAVWGVRSSCLGIMRTGENRSKAVEIEMVVSQRALQMGTSFPCRICVVGFLFGVCLTTLFLAALTSGSFAFGGISFSSFSNGITSWNTTTTSDLSNIDQEKVSFLYSAWSALLNESMKGEGDQLPQGNSIDDIQEEELGELIFFNTNTFSLGSQVDWDLPPKFDEYIGEEFEDCEGHIVEDVHVVADGKYNFLGENDYEISPLPIVVNGMHIPISNIKSSQDNVEENCAFNYTPMGISTAPKEVTPILINGSCILLGSDIPSIIGQLCLWRDFVLFVFNGITSWNLTTSDLSNIDQEKVSFLYSAWSALLNESMKGEGDQLPQGADQLDRSVPSICDAREVSYVGLDDGNHTFEVCTNGSGGTSCASYNWTVG
ncbi:hypothetical protein RHGRI_027252 [Rhododendron griersonianum]|uniref:Uncharacterized protein n=1 Tax=Rhododendron griersonianum TaxID=479676 RepID=A0AAV6J0R3_9ERIC|nr:hypothetical protein RHGRI_027252 [Rhododendron griersonianum]